MICSSKFLLMEKVKSTNSKPNSVSLHKHYAKDVTSLIIRIARFKQGIT